MLEYGRQCGGEGGGAVDEEALREAMRQEQHQQMLEYGRQCGGAGGGAGDGFQTDTQISDATYKERELQQFDFGSMGKTDEGEGGITHFEPQKRSATAAADDAAHDGSLEGGSMGGWDQFAANEKLYNVKTDYHDELYTTKLNKTAMSKEQIEKAHRLAAEIEKGAQRSNKASTTGHQGKAGAVVDDKDKGDGWATDVTREGDMEGREEAAKEAAAT
mmetsp:Transcript_31981/g.62427  ORF Transcript_31981/g.62427 Transcript_31981/m.62427 type:complete len:217 (-) Transcript_31981:351-1001(-)